MALKQYKPGTSFPGRMGRTIGESEPGLAGAAAGERRRPQCFVHGARRHRLRQRVRPNGTGSREV